MKGRKSYDGLPEQELLLVISRDDQQELLQHLHDQGLQAKALIS